MQYIEDDLPPHTVAETMASLGLEGSTHPPRILLLYGSLRERSFSRFLAEEAARVLTAFGAETRIFRPHELPVFDRESYIIPGGQAPELSAWSEGHVWVSPEQHGSMTGVFKNQIDWIHSQMGQCGPVRGAPRGDGSVGGLPVPECRQPTQDSWSLDEDVIIPNQSSVAKAWQEFDEMPHGPAFVTGWSM